MLPTFFTLILMLLTPTVWASQPVFTLHGFSGSDGGQPSAPLVMTADDSIFSTTKVGGANNTGAIYRISNAGTFTLLYSFSNNDGSGPNGLVRASDGNFYGTTHGGGVNGNGTVFRVTPTGNLTILYAFTATTSKTRSVPGVNGTTATITESINADGAAPLGLILGLDGQLYGTTTNGGKNGNGVVFRIATDGTFATLYNFSELTYGQPVPYEQQTDLTNADGASPNSTLILGADGAFYGVAAYGGPNGQGVIFRITAGGVLTRITSYGGTHEVLVHQPGPPPTTATIAETETITLTPAADGSFYGTTEGKATQFGLGAIPQTDFGSVFHLTPSGSLTTLHTFTVPDAHHRNVDGASPVGALTIGPNGHLYGTGSAGGENAAGAIFELTPDGASFTTLYSFNVGDGIQPEGSMLFGSNGNLYGTAISGGPNSSSSGGVVFEVSTTPLSFVLHEFNGDEGFLPISLLQGKDGDFYGVNYSSTSSGNIRGSVFRAHLASSTANSVTINVLHPFGYARPVIGLIQGNDGALYGATEDFIYRVTTAGIFNKLYDFTINPGVDGGLPFAGVAQATDGNFYGVTSQHGSLNGGTLFRLTPAGGLTVLYAFSGNGFEGYSPSTPLIQASDSKLYGMTNRGGVTPNSADGAIFSLSLSGTLTNMHEFGSRPGESVNPFGALVEGQDGFLYGATLGIYEPSTIFKLPKNADASRPNDLITVHTFINTEGGHSSGLLQAKDGNFYGLLGSGGSTITGGVGIIYRLKPSGNLTVLHQFYGPDGSDSRGQFYASLIEGKDGNLYGVAPAGGTATGKPLCYSNYINGYGCGTLFRLAIGRPGGAVDVASQIVATLKGSSHPPGSYKYTFTFTNTGEDLPGPVYMVLDNLPAGAVVINADGVTQQSSPTNSPYIIIVKRSFAKGATTSPVSLVLNRSLTNTFSPRYLSGSGP